MKGKINAEIVSICAMATIFLGGCDSKPLSNDQIRRNAEHGDPEAQLQLGEKFLLGTETNRDEAIALKWIRESADQGNARGEYILATMYWNGEGTSTNRHEAFLYFQAAAKHDLPEAQEWMGLACLNGLETERDGAKAEYWLKESANQGFAHAQYSLGEFYTHNHRNASWNNFPAAEKWMRKAADKDVAKAQKWLASYLANPKIGKKKLVEAYKWAEITNNRKLADSLTHEMTPSEIHRGESMSIKFRGDLELNRKRPSIFSAIDMGIWLLFLLESALVIWVLVKKRCRDSKVATNMIR